jgi:hypothetical protein
MVCCIKNLSAHPHQQGCQMAYFQTKNPNLGRFWTDLVYFMHIWSILRLLGIHILWPFGIFCEHLVYFMVIWFIFPVLVCCTKKYLATLLTSRAPSKRCQFGSQPGRRGQRCTRAVKKIGKNLVMVFNLDNIAETLTSVPLNWIIYSIVFSGFR